MPFHAQPSGPDTARRRIAITGTVQGVGFRPFVDRLAYSLGLSGFARNTDTGLAVEVQGETGRIRSFLESLRTQAPPLARIHDISFISIPPQPQEAGFRILPSTALRPAHTGVSPDTATCPDCLEELFSNSDRRCNHPFINCTHCGPRFTIIRAMPYDRPNTTMAGFPMCHACLAEYENPDDRRYHAQPVACPQCGPVLTICNSSGEILAGGGDAIDRSVHDLAAGRILAIKGLGGYHLACAAGDAVAVSQLRRRKHRPHRPLAVMVEDVDRARAFCRVSPGEEAVLKSPRRAIVLLEKLPDANEHLCPEVAPGQHRIGVLLPYTPLHHLLLRGAGAPLIMTSANRSGEPIIFEDDTALSALSGVADAFLTHDRPIHTRCDDSVSMVLRGREYPVRRSRGYAPGPVALPRPLRRNVLALGADMNNVFCLAREGHAVLSHHIGDLDTIEAEDALAHGLRHFMNLFNFSPDAVAHDMHPDYRSTRMARSQHTAAPRVAVQHHHAHVISCLADAGHSGPVIGVAFDGLGYGTDGALWGGEFLIAHARGFTRVAHLAPMPMPGGDMAVKEPWRMAATLLHMALGPDFTERSIDFNKRLDRSAWNTLSTTLEQPGLWPQTTSAGRLFDAVAALVAGRDTITYQAQAAMELESLYGDTNACAPYDFDVEPDGAPQTHGAPPDFPHGPRLVVNWKNIVRGVVRDLERGADPANISAGFHATVARVMIEVCTRLGDAGAPDTVALSGGVFLNARLVALARDGLERAGFNVLTHGNVPPGDGGLCLGQAVIADAMCETL